MIHVLAVLFIALRLILPANTLPQASAQFNDPRVNIQFGKAVDFQVRVSAAEAVQSVYLHVDPAGGEPAYYPMSLSADGLATFHLDPNNPSLAIFSTVSYSFQARLASGLEVNSFSAVFSYNDDRFTWKQLENSRFAAHWYGDRDVAFGQKVLNAADSGLAAAQKLVPGQLAQPVQIYIYASAQDMQGARKDAPNWVAGHAVPDLSQILISVPAGPSEQLELDRQLPHELVHVLQYQLYGARMTDFPAWLVEGTASVAEKDPNPEYASVLASSLQQDQLIPMESLCASFPRDASGAFLSYAQSQSFVSFLYKKFGASQLSALYDQYKNGLGCKEGVEAAYGQPLSQLEYRWRLEALGADPAAIITQKLLPYLLFLVLILASASIAVLWTARRRRG